MQNFVCFSAPGNKMKQTVEMLRNSEIPDGEKGLECVTFRLK